jgi:hypothetical protein
MRRNVMTRNDGQKRSKRSQREVERDQGRGIEEDSEKDLISRARQGDSACEGAVEE